MALIPYSQSCPSCITTAVAFVLPPIFAQVELMLYLSEVVFARTSLTSIFAGLVTNQGPSPAKRPLQLSCGTSVPYGGAHTFARLRIPPRAPATIARERYDYCNKKINCSHLGWHSPVKRHRAPSEEYGGRFFKPNMPFADPLTPTTERDQINDTTVTYKRPRGAWARHRCIRFSA